MTINCSFSRVLVAELLKLRRSKAIWLVGVFPIVFIFLDVSIIWKLALKVREVSTVQAAALTAVPIKAIGNLWVGYFHPLLLALLPALLFRAEHRFKAWRHLHALPISPRILYLAKFVIVVFLMILILALVVMGLWIEWKLLSIVNPALHLVFPFREIGKVLGWLLIGSWPLLGLYTWLADRIESGLIPIVFGLIGLMLMVAISGQEIYPSWRRDFIPWVLPYSTAQQAIEQAEAKQTVHSAAQPFQREMDLRHLAGVEVIYLPSGRKVTSVTTIPDFYLYPPPPTPPWALASFSAGLGIFLVGIGWWDAGRKNRP